jgi:hypothetical protein
MNAQAKARKPKRDLNQLAASIVAEATGDAPPPEEPDVPAEDTEPEDDGKNPAAVALGRLGGKKGGPARAAKLSAKRRTAIAKKAAKARWEKKDE